MAASPQVRCVVTWAYCMAITSISLFPSITCRVQGLLSREELRNPIRLHQDVERDTCKLFKKASKVCHLSVLPTLKGAHIHIHIHIHTHMYTHTHTYIYTHTCTNKYYEGLAKWTPMHAGMAMYSCALPMR